MIRGVIAGGFDRSIVGRTAHRPWPMPASPWLMTQSWHDLLFAHWRVDASQLRSVVPAPFEIDLFEGEAWLGVVPFYMTNVGVRAVPAVPWLSSFPELNVRTYVRVGDRPGVYFFSLDAGRRLAVATARALLNLPYHFAAFRLDSRRERVGYRCDRQARRPAMFEAEYGPVGAPFAAARGSLEYFLTERYCLYHRSRRGHPYRLEIQHPAWSLQPARAEIAANTMAAASDVTIDGPPALLHFSARQDVIAWAPERLRFSDRRCDPAVSAR
jgi:uncharacterized protein YqjF (DUF2071 family)